MSLLIETFSSIFMQLCSHWSWIANQRKGNNPVALLIETFSSINFYVFQFKEKKIIQLRVFIDWNFFIDQFLYILNQEKKIIQLRVFIDRNFVVDQERKTIQLHIFIDRNFVVDQFLHNLRSHWSGVANQERRNNPVVLLTETFLSINFYVF